MSEEHRAEGVFGGLVDEVVGYLQQPVSVHLTGTHGSGRSRLLDLVADRLDDDGIEVVRLFGNPAWRAEPYGGLLGVGIGATTSPAPPRRSPGDMVAALTRRLGSGRAVVVIDGADELDPQTAGALVAVHRQGGLTVLTSSQTQHPIPRDALMLALSPGVRIPMPVLTVDEVHAVARELLGASLDAVALARLVEASGGLYGLARAIVAVARQTGSLQRREGVWTLDGDVWSEHLGAAVAPFMAGGTQEDWNGATEVALEGTLPLDEADARLGRPLLDRLFNAGVLRHVPSAEGPVVGVYPPLLAEYLRREGSAFGRANVGDRLLPDAQTVAAADVSVRNVGIVREGRERLERAREDWERRPDPETALALVRALRAVAAGPEEIDRVLEAAPRDDSDVWVVLVAWQAVWLANDRNDQRAALSVLDAAARATPRRADFLRLVSAHVTFTCEGVPSDELMAPPSDPGDAQAAEAHALVRTEVLISLGLVERARAVLGRVNDEDPVVGIVAAQTGVMRGLAAVLAGRLDEGISHALDGIRWSAQTGDLHAQQGHSYVAIVGLTLAGRLSDAATVLFRVTSSPSLMAYREIFQVGILMLGVRVANQQGRRDYARAILAQTLATKNGGGPFYGMASPPAAAVMAAIEPGESAPLWALVDRMIERRYLAYAMPLACDAIELGEDARIRERLVDACADVEGPLLRAMVDYVQAAAEADQDGLAAAAAAFHGCGALLYEVRAHVTRALLLRKAGRASEAAAIADRAWRHAAHAELDRSGQFSRLADDIALTDREIEIVRLLGTPHTAGEVARLLQMSVRTVETHVHNAARKIGASGRDALVRAVSTWLRPPTE
jgi:DNA-binding CsgD family transcriptional regulator